MSSSKPSAWGTAPTRGDGSGSGSASKGPPSSILQAMAKPFPPPPPPMPSPQSLRRSHSSQGQLRRTSSGSQRQQLRRNSSAGGASFTRTSSGGGGRSNKQQRGGGNKQQQQQQQQQQRRRPSAGAGSGGGATSSQQSSSSSLRASTKTLEEIELLYDNDGSNVQRRSVSVFLSCRMDHLQAPSRNGDDATTTTLSWTPHEKCDWTNAPNRLDVIRTEMDKIWNFEPLSVNDATRWKAKVMVKQDNTDDNNGVDNNAEEEMKRKAFVILNKLSWTTLDKLTKQFLETLGIGTTTTTSQNGNAVSLSKDVIRDCMALVVENATLQPHFAELYARFSAKLTAVHKTFRKTLLALCQELFEETDKEQQPEHIKSIEDPVEREFELTKLRKKSIGLMKFIGELYQLGLIKGHIMIGCLQRLLVPDDEERLECFVKLMTTIGSRLHEDEDEPEMKEIWETVYSMAGRSNDGPVASSTRIKFLLIDLIELKDNGWVQRRQEEKATTLAQIQRDVAQEEQKARQRSFRKLPVARSQSGRSTGGYREDSSSQKSITKSAVADKDGFVQVSSKPKSLRRSSSDSIPKSSLQMAMTAGGKVPASPRSNSPKEQQRLSRNNTPASPKKPPPTTTVLQPKECGKKAENILKEYFVGGDTDDAVLCMHEIVGVGNEGHLERGAAVIEAGVLLVMEMKEEHARKLLQVMSRCLQENKISKESLPKGLNDPLEFLRDIEIDAPHAASILAMIVADWIKLDLLSLDFLRSPSLPEYFRTEGRPAEFVALVLAKRGLDVLQDSEIEIVSSLMTEEEKKVHPSVRDWISSFSSS